MTTDTSGMRCAKMRRKHQVSYVLLNLPGGTESATSLKLGGQDDRAFAPALLAAVHHNAPDSAAAAHMVAAVIKATATSTKKSCCGKAEYSDGEPSSPGRDH